MTVKGIGDDGKEYTINGFKVSRQQAGRWIEEQLCSIRQIADGQSVEFENENPLVFWFKRNQQIIRIRCSSDE